MTVDQHRTADPQQLQKAFAKLPPRHQEMITLARADDISFAEIGNRMGLSIDEVERRLAEAIFAWDLALERLERPWWRLW